MRYVDADKLYPDCRTIDGKLAISQSQLANATTVEPETMQLALIDDIRQKQMSADKAFLEGYEKGKSERPQGEWIMNKTSARGRNYTCTFCKNVSRNKFKFCPSCGARMVKDGGEKEKL